FLDAELFKSSFLKPCEAIRKNVGVIIFEFSHFHERDFKRGRDFLPHLDRFLRGLPAEWQYSVEIRNQSFLHPEYFAVLRSHGVAHCYNSWDRMPSVAKQMAIKESSTAEFVAGRFLLSPGRKYQAAVSAFQPYTQVQAPDLEV